MAYFRAVEFRNRTRVATAGSQKTSRVARREPLTDNPTNSPALVAAALKVSCRWGSREKA